MSNTAQERDVETVMRRHGTLAYPREACGLVLAMPNGKTEVIECANVHEAPEGFFRIDRVDYTRAADRGKIIGVWHTHPNGKPEFSDADRVGCEVSGVNWYLMSITVTGDDIAYSPVAALSPSGFVMPYTGRPYIPGVFDCWTLVVDYYRREFGIELRTGPYTLQNGEPGWLQFSRDYQKSGLVLVLNDEPKRGDIFFIQDASARAPNHAAVYIGDDIILHHSLNRLSKHDIYGGYYQKHTAMHVRHKDLM